LVSEIPRKKLFLSRVFFSGLITYVEQLLLLEDEVSTTKQKEELAVTVVHEISHMYFGNLLNPKWWDYIWLSEGFATLFEGYITDLLFPEWRYKDTHLLTRLQTLAFAADASESIRPMTKYVEKPMEIMGLFDDIAYAKCKEITLFRVPIKKISLNFSWLCSPDVPVRSYNQNIFERCQLLLEQKSNDGG
jgi:hypothetical protein